MAVIYITQPGTEVSKRGGRLHVVKEGKTLQEWPIVEVSKVVLVGDVKLTPKARGLLFQRGIEVQFHSDSHAYQGRLIRTGSRSASLRYAQFLKLNEPQVASKLAQTIMRGKWLNQRTLLQTQQQATKKNLTSAIKGITQTMQKAQQARDIELLRNLDGQANAYYFGAWQALIPKGFNFTGRAYNPPPDPINALLSFAYALLRRDILATIQHVGLDPYLGFLHTYKGQPALALDLMEEFRPIVVDQTILTLLQQNRINPTHFELVKRKKPAIHVNPTGQTMLIRAYEEQLHAPTFYPIMQQNTTLRRIYDLQTRQLARFLVGELKTYKTMTALTGRTHVHDSQL